MSLPTSEFTRRAIDELKLSSALFYDRGWAFGTCGNYSAVIARDPLRLLINASGRDKRCLTDADFVLVDETGQPVPGEAAPPGDPPRPSAESLLHVALATMFEAGSVLHTHSVWNTVLSDLLGGAGELVISGYEMLKGLSGVNTHEHTERIPIFENTQDIAALALDVRRRLPAIAPRPHAFLIRRHGLYTWGRDIAEARRHVEVLEFLFEILGRTRQFARE